jgi:hypothetical protein
MENPPPVNVDAAVKHYQALLRAKKAYDERQRQAKKDAGTYRGRGRPRKNPVSADILI